MYKFTILPTKTVTYNPSPMMSTITWDSQPSPVSGTSRDLKSNTKNRSFYKQSFVIISNYNEHETGALNKIFHSNDK
ncbi:hypothetical protein TNCV_3538602 [Trichonephila clavipes]|nr:hypothetical protein TNCV_3538602 [Trichonephila clavipes]